MAFPRWMYCGQNPRPAIRRYLTRLSLSMGAYMAILFPVAYFAHRGGLPPKPWLYIVAVAPALPVIGCVWAVLRYLDEEEDEYQRMLNVRAYAMATGMTLALTTGWGFLQNFAGLPSVPLFYVFMMFCIFQGLAAAWQRWTNR